MYGRMSEQTHALCVLAMFFTALFRSSLWCARSEMGRDKERCSSWREGSVSDFQISCNVGTASFASERIVWTSLWRGESRFKPSATYTCAENWPSICGVVRIRPWCNEGSSKGPGGTIVVEIGGSFLISNTRKLRRTYGKISHR